MKSLLPTARRFPLRSFALCAIMGGVLVACGGGSDFIATGDGTAAAIERTPTGLQLERIGAYSAGVFAVSAAEITAFDPASKRVFVVNAQAGAVDVLDLSDPTNPTLIDSIDANAVLAGAVINSVAVRDGLVAVAIEAALKTDNGKMALYRASDLKLLGSVTVGAQPDMVLFTPDGKYVMTANEGEPSDDYQIDPEGSISIIDIADTANPVVNTASFTAFNGQEVTLRARGVRIFGPDGTGVASAAKDFEPEYITVSSDSKTAWVTLQENNAFAKVDIASATVTDILPLGYKDHGVADNEIDVSDSDGVINIKTWPGVRGMYLPDAMASYSVAGKTYLVTANEGDARAWGEDNPLYFGNATTAGDASKGFVEEFRVKHLVHASGFSRRAGDDLPPQLAQLGTGGLLNPTVFGYCGAVAGNPGACRDDEQLGRLNITWTMGYQKDSNGDAILYNNDGIANVGGTKLMYDELYAFGARSFSIWSDNGELVWDSGAEIEQFLASDTCKAGKNRDIDCKTYFNSNHEEGNGFDNRSDNKGPEPEGVTVGKIGDKTFAFIGLERMGGVLVYDITDPTAPLRVDYLNPRQDWTTADPSTVLDTVGDLGPEGLAFVSAAQSPNGKPLLIVGNEVSGTTAVLQLNLTY